MEQFPRDLFDIANAPLRLPPADGVYRFSQREVSNVN